VQLDLCKVHSFFFPPDETNSLFSRTPYSSQDNNRRDNKQSFSSARKKPIPNSEETILLARSESPCGANAAKKPLSNRPTDFPLAETFSDRKPRTLTCRVKRKHNFHHIQTGLAVKP
jgi:hypothetical protein